MSSTHEGAETDAVRGYHGKWSKPGVPHKGWVCVEIEDLGSPTAECEMCENTTIRLAHHMQHPAFPEILVCGCICAGNMEGDVASAQFREKSARNASGRRQRWLSRKWRRSKAGNEFINLNGYNIVIFENDDGWIFRITNSKTNDGFTASKVLATQDAAKLRAFDAMIWMKARGR